MIRDPEADGRQCAGFLRYIRSQIASFEYLGPQSGSTNILVDVMKPLSSLVPAGALPGPESSHISRNFKLRGRWPRRAMAPARFYTAAC